MSCGGGGDAGAEGAADGLQSSPAQLVEKIIEVASDAKSKPACKEVNEVNKRSPLQLVCPPESKEQRATMRATRTVRAATYGDAAIVEYIAPDAKKGAAILLYRDGDREWTVHRWGLGYPHTIGTQHSARAETRKTVLRYLRAVEARDCRAFDKYAVTVYADSNAPCEREFVASRPLAKVLQGDRTAELAYVDGNETFAFYRLTIDEPKPHAYTVSTLKTDEGSLRPYVVMDVASAPVR
jgi:hypothetical protein